MNWGTQRLLFGFISIAINCLGVSPGIAAPHPAFAKANQAFSEGQFQQAIDGYQGIMRSGQWSASLFYNLGNAWFRLGDHGQAILNYERAVALDPHHPEALANLRLARDEARALELEKGVVERYLYTGTSSQYSIATSFAVWLALFAGTHLFFLRRRSARLITLVILSFSLAAAGIFALYTLETGSNGTALAIVIGKDVEARLATADNAKGVLSLPPGSQIKILSERGDWIYAALPNDLRGWIPADSAARVRL